MGRVARVPAALVAVLGLAVPPTGLRDPTDAAFGGGRRRGGGGRSPSTGPSTPVGAFSASAALTWRDAAKTGGAARASTANKSSIRLLFVELFFLFRTSALSMCPQCLSSGRKCGSLQVSSAGAGQQHRGAGRGVPEPQILQKTWRWYSLCVPPSRLWLSNARSPRNRGGGSARRERSHGADFVLVPQIMEEITESSAGSHHGCTRCALRCPTAGPGWDVFLVCVHSCGF